MSGVLVVMDSLLAATVELIDVAANSDMSAQAREALPCVDLAAAREARAAVAGLIDALRNAPCYCEEGEGGERDIVCDRCAALARIGGAA